MDIVTILLLLLAFATAFYEELVAVKNFLAKMIRKIPFFKRIPLKIQLKIFAHSLHKINPEFLQKKEAENIIYRLSRLIYPYLIYQRRDLNTELKNLQNFATRLLTANDITKGVAFCSEGVCDSLINNNIDQGIEKFRSAQEYINIEPVLFQLARGYTDIELYNIAVKYYDIILGLREGKFLQGSIIPDITTISNIIVLLKKHND